MFIDLIGIGRKERRSSMGRLPLSIALIDCSRAMRGRSRHDDLVVLELFSGELVSADKPAGSRLLNLVLDLGHTPPAWKFSTRYKNPKFSWATPASVNESALLRRRARLLPRSQRRR